MEAKKTIDLSFPSSGVFSSSVETAENENRKVGVLNYGDFTLEVTNEATGNNKTKIVEINFIKRSKNVSHQIKKMQEVKTQRNGSLPWRNPSTMKVQPLHQNVKSALTKGQPLQSKTQLATFPDKTANNPKDLLKNSGSQKDSAVLDLDKGSVKCQSYNELLKLSKRDLILNSEEFVCSLCENFITRRQGVVLKSCLHSFCCACLVRTINNDASPTGVVNCPMKTELCSGIIDDEEVQKLLGSDHEAFVLKVMLSLDEMAREKGGRLFETLPALLDAENYDFVPNTEAFGCAICLDEIEIGNGVVLKECLHKFCKDCLIESVKHSDESEVKCPFIDANGSCEFNIQHREIRGLVPDDVLDKHLEKSLKFYENTSEDAFHCQTPDCRGFIINEGDKNLRGFTCQVCEKVNCIGCKAIHENQNCAEYQDTINPGHRQLREDAESENAIKNMIAAEQAMWCPRCGIPVMKDDGCDYITCTACRLGICWITKKPRHPITKNNGKVIDGCHCNFATQRCHPQCGNCH